jgi:CheY-like chemotaxis protein/anti-sigma regulatory factor (Ser/Thr protein kinase)
MKRPLHVLLVDDCPTTLRLSAALLARLGARTATASTCADALAALRAHAFDAALIDLGLPDGTGDDLARAIRAGDTGADRVDLRMWACTADDAADLDARVVAAGMNGVVRKPFDMSALKAIIDQLAAPGAVVNRTAASPPSDALDQRALDAQGLLARVDADGGTAADLLEAFLSELPPLLDEIRSAIKAGKHGEARALSHRLRGAAAGVGGTSLQRLAGELEAASRSADDARLRSLADRLQPECGRLRDAVRAADLRSIAAAPATHDPMPSTASGTVLVVDDDPTLRRIARGMLLRAGWTVAVAEDAFGAMAMIERIDPANLACVVADHEMPGMSGLDLMRWIHARDPDLSVLIATVEEDRATLAASVRAGALDLLQKPLQPDIVGAAVASAATRTQRQRGMARAQQGAHAMGRTQQRMLQAQSSSSLPISVAYFPRSGAGGDFFSATSMPDGRVFFLLSDVSGHDLQAAYLSAYFHGMARGMLEHGATSADVLARCNRVLAREWSSAPRLDGDVETPPSIAVCSLVCDPVAGSLEAVVAGTPAPAHVHADGRIDVVGARGGAPLGWFDDFHPNTTTITYGSGGALVLWSDGLDELAQTRSVSVLAAAYALRREHRSRAMHADVETAGDDILVASIELDRNGDELRRFHPLVMWRHRGNEAYRIDELCAYWSRSLRYAIPDLGTSSEHDVVLAVREAMLNAFEHGCQGREDQLAKLQISFRPSDRVLRAWVEDSGPGHSFDRALYEHRAADELLSEHRGLTFIHHLADEVRSERNGASLAMDFVLRPNDR